MEGTEETEERRDPWVEDKDTQTMMMAIHCLKQNDGVPGLAFYGSVFQTLDLFKSGFSESLLYMGHLPASTTVWV